MAANQIKLSTTGIQDPVTLEDLGGRSFDHPTTDFDLLAEFSLDELLMSSSLRASLDDGEIILKDQNDVQVARVEDLAFYNVKDKLDATVAPTTSNDKTEGYGFGSRWVIPATNQTYVCLDPTEDSAVWVVPLTVGKLTLQNSGTPVANTPHKILNIIDLPAGIAAVSDAGSDAADFDIDARHDLSNVSFHSDASVPALGTECGITAVTLGSSFVVASGLYNMGGRCGYQGDDNLGVGIATHEFVDADTVKAERGFTGSYTAHFFENIVDMEGASVQTGEVTLAANDDSQDVTISSVTTNQSVLLFGVSINSTEPQAGLISGQIVNSTTIRFQRVQAAGSPAATIRWHVVSSSDLSVQRGSRTLTNTQTDQAVSAVTLANTAVIVSYRSEGNLVNANDYVEAYFTSTTNLRFITRENAMDTNSIEWQVVEFSNATVQSGSTTFGSSDYEKLQSVSTYDDSKSWLVMNYSSANGSEENIGQKLVLGCMDDSTHLKFKRDAIGQQVYVRWFLVTFTDDTDVQHCFSDMNAGDPPEDYNVFRVRRFGEDYEWVTARYNEIRVATISVATVTGSNWAWRGSLFIPGIDQYKARQIVAIMTRESGDGNAELRLYDSTNDVVLATVTYSNENTQTILTATISNQDLSQAIGEFQIRSIDGSSGFKLYYAELL